MSMFKLCSCGKPIIITDKKCASCAPKVENYAKARNKQRHKEYDSKRDKKFVKFYNSKEWKAIRQIILMRDNGLCIECLSADNRTKAATLVDHIIPIKISYDLRLNINNLQSLCNKCHAIKTKEDKDKYKL